MMKRLGAFTLIELLVVIAIIAILAAILFPVFAQAREAARKSTCLSNSKQLNLGMQQYIQDYDERFPAWYWGIRNTADSGSFWNDAIYPYVKNTKVYQCPDDVLEWTNDDFQSSTPDGGAHDLFAPCWRNGVKISGCTYFWDKPNNPNFMSYGINEGISNARKLASVKSPASYVMLGEAVVGWFNGWEDSSGARDNNIIANIAFSAQSAGCCMMWENWGIPQNWINQYGSTALDAATRHSGGTNFTFVDGHSKWERWQKTNYWFASPRT